MQLSVQLSGFPHRLMIAHEKFAVSDIRGLKIVEAETQRRGNFEKLCNFGDKKIYWKRASLQNLP